MVACLEHLPTELFLTIFDYLWAHELYHSFAKLNAHIDEILFNTQLHISSKNENILYSPHNILSLTLTSTAISLEEFTNLRSLTLIRCNLDNLFQFPPCLSRLCVQNINLPESNLKLIFENTTLINVQLNLYQKITISPSVFNSDENVTHIKYLTMNYISLNDTIQLLEHTKELKYLYVSLFGIHRHQIRNLSPVPSLTRLVCLSMGITFDTLCFEFLSIYFPNLTSLSIFTSFVEQNLFINSLEQLLLNNLPFVKKFHVSAQFIINRTLPNDNIESIATRFRTAFWLKRNCRATFKYCHDDPHTIRVYLQTNNKCRTRPSRF